MRTLPLANDSSCLHIVVPNYPNLNLNGFKIYGPRCAYAACCTSKGIVAIVVIAKFLLILFFFDYNSNRRESA